MTVLAHGIGGRSDLPVPLWLALYAGAAAVLIAFFALTAFWPRARLRGALAGRPLPPAVRRLADAAGTRVAARTLGLTATAGVLVVAWAGVDDPGRNPAPTWFYVWFWVGLPVVSALLGPVWRWLNPARTVSAWLRALLCRPDGAVNRPVPVVLPARVGYWPAVVGLAIFLWFELVYPDAAEPRLVAGFITAYGLAQVAGGVVFGDEWFARGDGFEVCSNLFGHLAPVGRDVEGRLVLRNPLDGLATLTPAPGLVTTIALLLGSTGFDGLSRTRIWKDLTAGVTPDVRLAIGTVGLAATVALVLVTYTTAARMPRGYAAADRAAGLEERFVHSLLPIALGYTVAHYFSFAVFQGQVGFLRAADPLGLGWDLFGTGERGIDYTVVGPATIALVQVGAVVTGHVVGVVAAHDRALATFPRRHHRRAQYSLLAAMVGYTVGGIALVVGP